MITCQIIGGLGNQLFQYAAARALAIHTGTSLQLDISGFNEYKLRNFDLAAFHTRFDTAPESDTKVYYSRSFTGKLRDRLMPMAYRKVYREPHFHFHSRFFKCNANVYLKGYWQSDKYFSRYWQQLKPEFRLKESFIEQVKQAGDKFSSENSVAVHIRRGDYLDPEVKRVHGIIPESYYRNAIAYMKDQFPNARIYYFSDNSTWVKENLPQQDAEIVSGIYSATHFEDLYLMSRCCHNIIANSSFSWWGAWLNENPEKKVIAPANWFNEGPKDTRDIYPENWIRL